MLRKIITMLLVLCMLLSCMFQTATAVDRQEAGKFTDAGGHWAAGSIEKWAGKGLIQGYPDGTFKPDATISRAEFCALLNRVFGFSAKSPENYADVPAAGWYADIAAIARTAGYTDGWITDAFKGDEPIKREEAVLALYNAFGFSAVDTEEYLSRFTDLTAYDGIPKEAIAALTAGGVLSGYPDKTFRPGGNISRAESVKIFDKLVGEWFNTPGAYTGAGITGNAVVNTAGVTLKDVEITGNLYLAEGIGDGDVTLDNVKVKGKTCINGGGANSIHINDSELADVIIDRDSGLIRVIASRSTIGNVLFESGGKFESADPPGTALPDIVIDSDTPPGQIIEISGNIGSIICNAPGVIIRIAAGSTVNSLTINDTAAGTHLTVDGDVASAVINASGIEVNGGKVDAGTTMPLNSSTNRPSSTGGGRSSSTPQDEQAAAPTFSPGGGTYDSAQTVTISTTTSGATIRYTLDDSAPTASSPVYDGPITVSQTTTIKAYAAKAGMTNSAIASATYTITTLPPPGQVAAPAFDPAEGTYDEAQEVTISCETEDAVIYYTLDGSDPSTDSTEYDGAITVSETTTIKAYAVKEGLADSIVVSATYTITPVVPGQVAAPTFDPAAGTYASEQTVTISCKTEDAVIYYTLDGSDPSTESAEYDGAITVSETTTIKAYAVKEGLADSIIVSATYTINPEAPEQVAAPTFDPEEGIYESEVAVTISCETEDAIIYYTLDGSDPSTESTEYDGAITVSETTTIKAYAVKEGMTDSIVVSATYTITPEAPEQAAMPAFSPAAGEYTGEQTISISSATEGATIRYTTDGSDPAETSAVYEGPITVSETTTIKAYAVKEGLIDSDIATAVYTITTLPPPEQAAMPAFSPAGGAYTSAQTIAISSATEGATIYYTLDGSTPTSASPVYTGPFTITATTTVKAYAAKEDMIDSEVASAAYTITLAPTNLALHRPAAASSSLGGSTASAAFDGIAATRWESVHGVDPQWLSVDIGASLVSGMKITWETAAGRDYKIQVSNDGEQWNDAYTKTGGASGAVENITFATPVSAEFVRMYGTARTTVYGYSIFEWEIYGVPDTTKAIKPVITPAAGTYTSQITVSMTDATPGAAIYYTTDGTVPTSTTGTLYAGPLTLTSTTTVKAIAVKAGLADSNPATSTFTVLPLGTPTGIVKSATTLDSVTLYWNAVTGATGYNVYRAASGDGTYSKITAGPIAVARFTDTGLTENTTYYYKISSVNEYEESPLSAPVEAVTVLSPEPDFGPNVLIFDQTMPIADVSSTLTSIFNQMERNQFGDERYAILFKPGTYNLTQTLRIGFYTHVAGLGRSPDDVTIGGALMGVDAGWFSGNATQNFWRAAENLSVAGNTKWAVSQAAPMRRVHIKGDLRLADGGWSSGGFLADSLVDGTITSESQQQWLSRNSKWGNWNGGVWNMVFVGNDSAPAGTWPSNPYTTVDRTPEVREKPFLYIDESGKYFVFVPDIQTNAKSISWTNGLPAGESIPIDQFYITHPESDTAATINAALDSGKHLLFTPGVYNINESIEVKNADTVILGLGFATLRAQNGAKALVVDDVDGVIIAGLTFDAGPVNSPVLMEVGPEGSSEDHSDNPIFLSDLFFRVGGFGVGKADVSMVINSSDVIGDFFWIWRADHGSGVGWNVNTTRNGLVVNGDDVTIYGLMVEHYHGYQTVWNGERGRVYFYQSEWPYDVPSQAAWMNGSVNGYASYKIADSVTSHEAWGLGMYSYFRDANVKVNSAMEAPIAPDVKIHNTCSVFLNGNGEITHVINDFGNTALAGNIRQIITEFPGSYMPKPVRPVFSPAAGTYESVQSVSISTETAGATIRYTTDGSTPTGSSAEYTGPIEVAATTTIKAVAFKDGMMPSDVATALYTINILPPNTVAAPVFTPPAGSYSTPQDIAISSATEGATIRYTLDGSTPNPASQQYGASVPVSENTTVKAYATKEGMNDSAVSTASYTFAPDFGPNVIIFDPSTPIGEVSNTGVSIFNQMERNQFGNDRYAILFKPGTYNLTQTLRIGFYTQVAGLGRSPDDVVIGGSRLGVDAGWMGGNATQNFWRSLENLSVAGDTKWAVAQAAPMRRVHIKGNLSLSDGGYSSGGLIADSVIDGTITSGSQQQWLSRNSRWGAWNGGVWNMVFVGNNSAPAGTWPQNPYTTIDRTPEEREKPYLYVDGSDKYYVFVPELKTDTKGITWAAGPTPGESIPIDQFYIARSDRDTAATINAALESGKHLLVTPGVYPLDATINVNRPDTVILGLGYATLRAENGVKALNVADVDGVVIAGLTFDAGPVNSPVLMEVGPEGSGEDHSDNPIFLTDLFFRVGGSGVGKADNCLIINSSDVIGDFFWIWRADHGSGIGWNVNTTKNGLIVNGDNVAIYGLMSEHFHEYQVLWNGEGGRVYFYQSEWAYDIPDQASWMDGDKNGYTSYKIADSVNTHEAWGLGIYSYFRDAVVKVDSAMEAPVKPDVKIHNVCSVFLTGNGEITHVINEFGATARAGSVRQVITEWPAAAIPTTEPPVFAPAPGTYTSAQTVTISSATPGAVIRYTTDGSMPTASSPVYAGPLTVAATVTIRAYAASAGLADSPVTTGVYTINIPQPTATLYPGNTAVSGVTPAGLDLTATAPATGGWTPTKTVSETPLYWYSDALTGSYAAGNWSFILWTNSPGAPVTSSVVEVSLYRVNADGSGAEPVGSPQTRDIKTTGGGNHSSTFNFNAIPATSFNNQRLLLKIVRAGGDGNCTMAHRTSDFPTRLTTPVFTDGAGAAAPVFSPAAGTYTSAQTVTISSATAGAVIRYTTDGSTPNASSAVYAEPIAVGANTTIKAYASKEGMDDSAVATAAYVINLPLPAVETPVFSPAAGTYAEAQTVSISSATEGASIHYTTDGTTPTTASAVYTQPIPVSVTTTVKALAVKEGFSDSAVATAIYTIGEDPWTLVWNDEFDGTSVDTTKWNFENKGDGFGNNEAQYYRPENATVEDGKLVINAKKESYGGRSYTSAKLFAQNKGDFKYGKIEASIRLPLGQGFWPAFWMMPTDGVYGGWAASGEVDIMEAKGRLPYVVGGTIHYGGGWPNNVYSSKNYDFPAGQSINEFHTYGIEWEPGEIRWYVDGNLFSTQTDWYTRGSTGEEKYSFPAPFDQEFYPILNLAIGGTFDGGLLPPDNLFPARMEVDYVRVYELTGRPYKTPSEPGSEVEPLPPGARESDITGNLVADVNFEQGIKDNAEGVDAEFGEQWNFVHNAAFGGVATAAVDTVGGRNYAKIDVTAAGSQPYSVQLEQLTTLGKGRWYKFSFDAKADRNRTLIADLGGGPTRSWTKYSGSYTAALTANFQHYEYIFQMTRDSDILTRIEYNLATSIGSVWIGSVRLEEISGPDESYTASKNPLPTSGNYIYNGAFDKYTIDRMAYWNVEQTGAAATVRVPENTRELTADVTDGGASPEAINVNQKGVQFTKGYGYRLSFRARAESPRTIKVRFVSKDGSTLYQPDQEVALTTAMQLKEVLFKMEADTDLESQLAFLLGGNNADVCIDDVLLVRTSVDYSDIDPNPLKNGDFSQGLANWGSWIGEGGGGTVSVVNGEARIAVTNVGAQTYSLQFYQPELIMGKDLEYRVAFDVRSSKARNLEISIENAAYTRYFTRVFAAGPETTHYEYTFTMPASDEMTYKFLLGRTDAATVGLGAHEIYIDNCVLEAINLPSEQAATPTFSPAAGVYTSAQSVTISSETADAVIRYTTDGTEPNSGSAPYGGPVTVSDTTTIKAYASKEGLDDSAVATATYTISPPSEDPWTLVWGDEFDGASVDTTKWNFENKGDGFGNNEAQYYRPENATVEDGKLVINAKKESYGGRSYTSAKLFAQNKGDFKYGKIEASIRLPLGQGFWPAFWMMPTDGVYGGWAASGEVDIMEAKGRLPYVVGGTLHYGGGWPNNVYSSKNYDFPAGQSINEFHTYTIEWEPGEFRWYVDGNLYQTQTNWYTNGSAGEEKYSFPAPFDQEFYPILNLAIGGTFDGGLLPPDDLFPAKMEVDYVRVYELTGRPYKTPSEPGTEVEPLPPGARESDATGNLVADVNFEQGIKDNAEGVDAEFGDQWNFVHNAQFNGAATAAVDTIDGRNYAKINVTATGSQPYSVQLEQLTTLGKGRWYKFSFDAKADRSRTLVADLGGGPSAGWSKYSGSYTAGLTTDFRHFEYVFQMTKDSDILTRIEYNCATSTGAVWIGNVRVEETSAPDAGYDASKNPLPNSGNHIYNGAFDKYTIDRMAYWNVAQTGAAATVGVPESTRELTVDITDGGASPEAITVDQKGVQLTNGNSYKLTFRARAGSDRTMKVTALSKDGAAAYIPESLQEISLTTSMQEYEVIFKMEAATDLESQLVFLLGGGDGDVYIDDVLLVQTNTDYSDVDFYPLKNGDFSQGLTKWETFALEGGAASFSVVNGEARIAVTGLGTPDYSVMLNQGNMILVKGLEYELSFDIRGPARDFEVTIENSAYTRIFDSGYIQMGADMQHYAFTFTPGTSDVRALKFLLGHSPASVVGTIFIDNVVLQVKDAPVKNAPMLGADTTGNLVGQPAEITFSDNAGWRAAVSAVKVNGVALDAGQYTLAEGKLTLAAEVFPVDQNYTVVVEAEGYVTTSVVQLMLPGDGSLVINGRMSNGNTAWEFWNNVPSWSSYTIADGVAAVQINYHGANEDEWGVPFSWSTQFKQSGIRVASGKTYELAFRAWSTVDRPVQIELTGYNNNEKTNFNIGSDQNAVYKKSFSGANVTLAVNFLLGYVENNGFVTPSGVHTVFIDDVTLKEVVSAPGLTADSTDNKIGQNIDITFTDNATWRTAITAVKVDGTALQTGQYSVAAGKITIDAGVFTAIRNYTITVEAAGYGIASVTQKIKTAAPNIALGKTYTASSNTIASRVAASAFDGNTTTTRWESASADPQWISVDLGSLYKLDSISIYWEAARASDYKIQVSTVASPAADSDWTDVYSIAGKTGSLDEITLSGQEARHVRMYGTRRATIYGYSIYELEVYGTVPAAPGKAAAPTFDPADGTYASAQTVTISSATADAVIRYTTDGTEPNSGSAPYGGPITVAATATVKAYASKAGMTDSEVSTAVYTINLALEKAAAPVFSPGGGNYTSPRSVTISSATEGAVIRYTADGSAPNASSAVYSVPITVSEATTIKAYAAKEGMADSDISTVGYTFIPVVATPVFTPAAGEYPFATVSISCATADAVIRYTTNGTTPNANSPVYSEPITVTATTTIRAYATKEGMVNSAVATGVYTIAGALHLGNTAVSGVTPAGLGLATTGPAAGGFTPTKTVTETPMYWYSDLMTGSYAAGNWSFILWTNSPALPVTSSIVEVSLYKVNADGSGAEPIGSPQTRDIKTTGGGNHSSAFSYNTIPAVSLNNQRILVKIAGTGGDGSCTMAHWTRDFPTRLVTPLFSESGSVAAPIFTPAAGTYDSARTVTISSATPGAVIRYTTDGTEPNSGSTVYSGPITVAGSTTIKAYASKAGMDDSAVITAEYILNLPPPGAVKDPVFSPGSGTYGIGQTVTISSATEGAAIRYTTDGSEPGSSSPVYTAPITLTATTTLKAYAFKDGSPDSRVVSAVYTIVGGITPVGLGSYTSVLPSGAVGPTSTIYKTPDFEGAVPTNSWESSIYWSQYSQPLFAHPLTYRCVETGLQVGFPSFGGGGIAYFGGHRTNLTVQNTAGNPPDARVRSASDWALDVVMGDTTATLVKGSPYAYFTFAAGNPRLVFSGTPSVFSGNASSQALGVTISGVNYGLFAPEGSTWSGIGTNTITCNLAQGKDYFSLAVLPGNSQDTLSYFGERAYAFITDTEVDWSYDPGSSDVTTTFKVTTTPREGLNTDTILALYPHQWRDNGLISTLPYTYRSLRGTMKTVAGTSFQTRYAYSGILPNFPDKGSYDKTVLNSLVNEFNNAGNPAGAGDTYWLGKQFGRLSNILPIAEQTGNGAAASNFVNIMKDRLEDWFTASPGETGDLFYRDNNWGTLIGYQASYGTNDILNDHHFHYGYYIHAAAQIGLRDPDWAGEDKWGGMVNELIKDIANWDRNDTRYPFLRNFDPYEGHSWASGNAMFADGNNQESSSEAINAWQAIILWGEATGNTAVRDLGIYLYTTEVEAINNYWFDIYGDVHDPAYGHDYASMVWGGKYSHEIWWAGQPSEVHGINYLPYNAASVYLGKDPEYVKENYDEMLQECGGTIQSWRDLMYMYYALYDPDAAAGMWNTSVSPEAGQTKAHTYHWIYNLKGMGLPDFTVRADTPLYGVFSKDGVRTYVAYNAAGSEKTVTFSDGFRMNVPARSMSAVTGDEVPEALSLSDSTVSFRHFGYTLDENRRIESVDRNNIVETEFRTKVIENEYVKVTLLPDFGGRILSIVYKPTGHDLLYQNPVGTPYGIGEGNFYHDWLMVYGGIFPTFPEPEHGKAWCLPWEYRVAEQNGDRITVEMSFTDNFESPGLKPPGRFNNGITGIRCIATVTVYKGRSNVDLGIKLVNGKNEAVKYEYWTCATLAPGSEPGNTLSPRSSEMVAPIEKVKSSYPWVRNIESLSGDGNGIYNYDNLAIFDNWQEMGIAYAYPRMEKEWWGVVNHENGEGILRIADNKTYTPGMKFWTWGANQSFAADPENFWDVPRPYIELWAGNSLEFFQDAQLAAGEEKSWVESYMPTAGLTEITYANQHAAISMDCGTDAGTGEVSFDAEVFTTHPNERMKAVFKLAGAEDVSLGEVAFTSDPVKANKVSVKKPGTDIGGGNSVYVLEIRSASGELLARAEMPITK